MQHLQAARDKPTQAKRQRGHQWKAATQLTAAGAPNSMRRRCRDQEEHQEAEPIQHLQAARDKPTQAKRQRGQQWKAATQWTAAGAPQSRRRRSRGQAEEEHDEAQEGRSAAREQAPEVRPQTPQHENPHRALGPEDRTHPTQEARPQQTRP